MAILTQSGRTAIAQSVKNQIIHLAWGEGSGSVSSEIAPEDPAQTSLIREVGRRVVDEVIFCVGNDEGELATPTGRFSISDVPTNNLFIKTVFDFEDGNNSTIRELGLFIGTETIADLPAGQKYFLPHQIANKGILLLLEHSVPIIRTPATRESFSFVVTF